MLLIFSLYLAIVKPTLNTNIQRCFCQSNSQIIIYGISLEFYFIHLDKMSSPSSSAAAATALSSSLSSSSHYHHHHHHHHRHYHCYNNYNFYHFFHSYKLQDTSLRMEVWTSLPTSQVNSIWVIPLPSLVTNNEKKGQLLSRGAQFLGERGLDK